MTYKIHYNKDGWLCDRYPYDLPIYKEECHIEVDEVTWGKTFSCDSHFSWRVVDGKLVHERYEPTPEHEIIEHLRTERERICFPVINRGQAWYNRLTTRQHMELDDWYKKWLDVTKTKIAPEPPVWLFSCENNKKECENGTN